MTSLIWLLLATAYAILLTLLLIVGPNVAVETGTDWLGMLLVTILTIGFLTSLRNYLKSTR